MIPRKYKKHKKTKKGNTLRSGNCIFDNVLKNRTLAALPNKVWQVDGTFYECSLVGEPNSRHFVLYVVDTSMNEIVVAKV